MVRMAWRGCVINMKGKWHNEILERSMWGRDGMVRRRKN